MEFLFSNIISSKFLMNFSQQKSDQDSSSIPSVAYSSTASIHKSFTYDVFVSFRGEDTRAKFIDHLYYALQQQNIYAYKDKEAIRKGKKISDELSGSIEDSRFYIIVFSKNYASSSWCLDELVRIMECHKTTEHTAFPVFYNVEPTEVRKQSGAVGEAFAKHRKHESAGKWKAALKEAADLAGWELKNTVNGHEAIFIQNIVEEISLQLRSIDFKVVEKLVGMETWVKDVVSSLETGVDDVRIIGIKGMGGAGKTTLARAVFDRISCQFESKIFVEDVREVSKASLSGLTSLQSKVLSHVLNKKVKVSSVYEGKNMMKKMMLGRKVLVAFDDVDDIEQLEALAGEPNWFKPGSTILITTRDEQVLIAHQVKLIFDVNLLSFEEAICLFSRYAFGRDIPVQGYEELSGQVIRYAAGLPLTIRVLGSFLCGKKMSEWIDALERLKTIPLVETLKILELSYDSLEEDYKEILLNVACILKGWSKDLAIQALESCGFHAINGLRVLQQKSLITISHDSQCSYERVNMHDHIEEMGRNIVRRLHPDTPKEHSRLWIDEEIDDILGNDLGTKATRYIRLCAGNVDLEILMKGLKKMTELRFLHVLPDLMDDYVRERIYDSIQYFPSSLQYLYWFQYPFWSLPNTFQGDNLVTLKMAQSKMEQLWEGGERKILGKLKILDLSHSKLKTLDIGLTPNLETLDLSGCRSLVRLYTPVTCIHLTNLDCTGSELRTLDIRQTPNLKYLDLMNCHYLEDLHFGLTSKLERLNLKQCYNLVQLHAPTGCLKNLVYLDLSGCLRFTSFLFHKKDDTSCSEDNSLEFGSLAELDLTVESLKRCPLHPESNLPKFQFQCLYKDNLRQLTTNLEMLISEGLCACTNPETFSQSISRLQRLGTLKLKGYPEALKNLDQLQCLEHLQLSHTMTVPDSICKLKHLKSLELIDCELLERLPEHIGRLESLEKLTLSCKLIKYLPYSMCMLKHLKSLEFIWCELLERLPTDIGQLACLEKLTLSSTNIKHLPDSICMLKHLKSLELSQCKFLRMLPEDIGRLESLEKLTLSFSNISHLPDSICMLKHLKALELSDCVWLEELPEDLGILECLEELSLSCENLTHLPDSICMLKHLKFLKLSECKLLENLPEDLGRLECLEELFLSNTKIKHLPDSISMLKHLKSLELIWCELLEKLPEDIGRLEGLEKLTLSFTKIKRFPDSICMLKHLKSIKLMFCELFEKLPEDIGRLICLEKLTLSSTNIKHLPDSICMLNPLKSLKIESCWLENLPEGLGRLESLEKLTLPYTRIRRLPDTICMLKHLKTLNLSDCELLEKLPEDIGRLKCLEKLTLSRTKIKHLPNSICTLKHLKSLKIESCLLEKLPVGCDGLESLEHLNLKKCVMLGDIPDSICKMNCLKELHIDGTCISQLPQNIRLLKGLRIHGSKGLLQSCGFTSRIQTIEESSYVDVGIPGSNHNRHSDFVKLIGREGNITRF